MRCKMRRSSQSMAIEIERDGLWARTAGVLSSDSATDETGGLTD